MAKKPSVDYKKKYLFALEILYKLMRRDIPVSDLPGIIKKLESED